MDSPTQDIVITGVGVVCPIGIGRPAFEEALQQQRSGIRAFGADQYGELDLKYGGGLPEFDPKKYVKPRKSIKLMCREIQTGFAAAALAVEDANLDTAATDSERFGVIMGSEMLYGEPQDLADVIANSTADEHCDLNRFGDRISHDMFPLWMLNYLPNMPACHIGIGQQAFGANNTIVQGDASSLLAISEAVSVISRGWCDVMICGGSGTRINVTHRAHITNEGLSHSADSPAKSCRPFDLASDGEVLGEGAGALIIESRSHAESRGAKPLAKILGCGSTHDGQAVSYRGTSSAAIGRSIRLAMQRADCQVADLDHVNAHGLSRPDWDRREAVAIREELGETPVTAMKSYFGNLGAGSGAVEAIASVIALANGHVAGTQNHENTDPECPIEVVGSAGKPLDGRCAMLMNQSTTGQAAAIVIGKA